MNDLQIFKNAEFGEIRTVIIENEPWFVGKDVAVILGYADPNKAIAMHVDEDDKLNDKSASSLGQRGGWLIKESGLYSLILSSKLASAKRFKKWVTSEVLPSIRKNGGYIAGQEHLSDDELMAKAVLVAQKKIEERDKVIEEQRLKIEADKPKTIFADMMLWSMRWRADRSPKPERQRSIFTWKVMQTSCLKLSEKRDSSTRNLLGNRYLVRRWSVE